MFQAAGRACAKALRHDEEASEAGQAEQGSGGRGGGRVCRVLASVQVRCEPLGLGTHKALSTD